MKDDKMIAVITYHLKGDALEIIFLDSMEENKGTGSKLIHHIEMRAIDLGFKELQVITTNDNLRAIAFYQKRGFRLSKVFVDAVKKARLIKPSIPMYAENGIPINDEILFTKRL